MTLRTAVLKKRFTSDGVEFVNPEAPLGKVYEVDEDSRRQMLWFNAKVGMVSRETITAYEDGQPSGDLITEILNFGKGIVN